MDTKVLLISGLVFYCVQLSNGAATLQQMKDSAKLIRDVCQPKFKISDDVANQISSGQIPDDKQSKCYINCVLEMLQAIKKGKFNKDALLKQIDMMLPDELKDEYKKGVDICFNVADGVKNSCEVSYLTLKCFVDNVPNFMFP